MLLHHGTTLRAAYQIVETGWQALETRTVIEKIASEYGVEGAAISELLAKHGRFVVVADNRGANASFAPDAAKVAHRWAQRAPEAEWETLWAVFHLLHPNSVADAQGWDASVAGRAWVWEQMRREPLAVLSFVTTYNELVALGARQGSNRRELGPPERVLAAWNDLSELSFDLPFRPDPARLVVTPIPRHLPRDVYAHKLGLSIEEFDDRAERGDFGEAASHGLTLSPTLLTQTPWWDSATAPFVNSRSS